MIIDPYLMAELVRVRQADCLAMAHRPRGARKQTPSGIRLVAGEALIHLGQWVRGCVAAPAPIKRPELTELA